MTTKAKKGVFHDAFDAMVNARARQASSYVNGALLMLDDDTLKSYGYERKELLRRPTAYYPF